VKRYDLIVLGGGAGGLTVAAGAASMGAKVALIEKEEEPGGDCLHYGCVPSKALISAAKKVYQARVSAEEFGFSVDGKPDLLHALRRVKAAIADIQKHDDADRFRAMGVEVLHGFGSFKDTHHVQIDDGDTLYGKRIVVSTGSSPVIPPIEGLKEAGFLTNESVFDIQSMPNRLFVIGAGPIGLELAQSFARFGSEVTVAEFAPVLFGREDEELVPYIQSVIEKELTLMLDTKVQKVEKLASGEKKVTVLQGTSENSIVVDEVLVAAGRRPNTDRIGLEKTGIETEKGYLVVKDTLQTSVSHIYAIGDVLQAFPFTHASWAQNR
jgi:pyruvate/2-oxoglutarate dehydrogenase complex dihydrolipoamide dehydrogenase (E3) component